MASFTVASDPFSIAASAAKTILQVTAPSTREITVYSWTISFDGKVTETPVRVQLLRQTSAGTMTSRTPLKVRPAGAAAALATASHSASAEPTASDILEDFYLTENNGYAVPVYAEGRDIEIAASGRIGIKITAPAGITTFNALASLNWEE